ncbi:MAG TPA: hypothetical protein VMB66_13665 [Candidatus Acidoferrales bacterium]|nr:hypothetical protein [Candidatus Acidoferrales bacterium]
MSSQRHSGRFAKAVFVPVMGLAFCCFVALPSHAQTDCADGNGLLEMSPPKEMTAQEIIRKFSDNETRVRDARAHYIFTQDVLVQTFNGKEVDGQFHEITQVAYDEKGRRQENVTYAEQPSLRGIQLSQNDMDDIRTFMPWILTTDQIPEYNLAYAGQQRVDDLDTYVFHVEPKKQEKDKRYFEGRVWVDNRDLEIVKLCGKSVPEMVHPKKNQAMDIRPMFVGYRQYIDGNWFPAYARVDDTLHFRAASVRIKEVVKFTGYKKNAPGAAPRP